MRNTFILFYLITSLLGSAQIKSVNPFFDSGDSKTSEVPLINLVKIGDYHLDEVWNAGNIYLNNGDSLFGYYLRYDIVKNIVEIIVNKEIKAIHGNLIQKFEWFSVSRLRIERFISKKNLAFDNPNQITGFVEILVDGRVQLLKMKKFFAPQEATSPTLINDTDQKIQFAESYFIGMNNKVYDIVGSKKKNLELFSSKSMNEFVREKNLRFNSEMDLMKIIEYYNK